MPLILSVAPTLVVSGEPELPSFDLGALCCASVLQLARLDFTLQPSSSLSEPSLIDDNDETAGLASILRRCALPPRQADERAFTALALSRLTALVEHSLFSLPQNYVEITRPRYAAGLPIPQRFILPGQLRLRAKERLEREGLWNLGGEVEADEKAEREKKIKGEGLDTDLIAKAKADEAERKERVRREFEKLKIVELAKEILSPFATKLGSQKYFYGDEPSTLDALVFAHLALLILLPLPTPIMHTLLNAHYPTLIAHTHRMRTHLFPNRSTWPTVLPPSQRNWSSFLSFNLFPHLREPNVRRRAGQKERTALQRRRYTWLAITGVSFATFALWQGIVPLPNLRFAIGGGDVREEEEEDD